MNFEKWTGLARVFECDHSKGDKRHTCFYGPFTSYLFCKKHPLFLAFSRKSSRDKRPQSTLFLRKWIMHLAPFASDLGGGGGRGKI